MISYLQAINISRRSGDNLLFRKVNTKINPERERKPGFMFKEKKELETLQHKIREIESEKISIESEMNSGNPDSEELFNKSKRFGEILDLLDEKEM
jgi:ATP-binding cassette subfamily F protein uup